MLDNFGHFHLSTISVVEIAAGIAKLRRMDQSARADAYESWLNQTLILFGSRVLDLGAVIAGEAGAMGDHAMSKGCYPGFADIAIAATAKVHGLTVLTRNLKHFTPLDVPCLDPFKLG